jgi:flagellar biosynthetic protein FliP
MDVAKGNHRRATAGYFACFGVHGYLCFALDPHHLGRQVAQALCDSPNQVMVGLALFLTLFLMWPIFNQINEQAYQPFSQGRITQAQAVKTAMQPLRTFMLKQTYNEEMNLFISLAKKEKPAAIEDIGNEILIPAFIISELKRAFIIGFIIFIPFLIIDMVVSSTLMSMGMMMLPPVMISLPFKLLLFILVDGWGLVIKTLISSFN